MSPSRQSHISCISNQINLLYAYWLLITAFRFLSAIEILCKCTYNRVAFALEAFSPHIVFAVSLANLSLKGFIEFVVMKKTDLDYFKLWFKKYVAQFYDHPHGEIKPIIMKEQHSQRTCQEILLLGRECGLSKQDLLLAETAALFHDIGRFPQWKHYSTFVDSKSEDHALLGLEVISRHQVLKLLSPARRGLIQKAIRHHNLRELPENLSLRQLLYSRLLRDADKLDIWRVVIMQQEGRSDLAEGLAGDLPLSSSYSSGILVELREKKAPDFSLVRNQNDMILLRLGWVFDLNFAPTCRHVLERNYVERLCSQLPGNKEIKEMKQQLILHLRKRITEGF